MLKWFKTNPQTAVILLLVGVLIFQYLFLSNSYKKEYYRLLKEQEKKYEQQIGKLHSSNDSILDINKAIEKQIADIDKQIAKKDAELAKLKKQNAQNTAKLNAMSDAELSGAFTELFN
jgi:septal ring factor EnvC (AmiA/AmiB activator)